MSKFQIEVGLPATYRQQLICAGIIKPADHSEIKWLIANKALYGFKNHIMDYLNSILPAL